ncbi:MAG TPA: Fur family transcriptional regulator [Candidatus Paceibacterota bacterium]|nr:Fur family transcriptional regulator [Candidatus Paceibacterota bacterium]
MEEKILKELRGQGHRITAVRREMVKMLVNAKAPLAASDILKVLQKEKLKANKTTVYRELEFLVEQNIAQEVEFGDKKKRYEISDKHHHHVVCVECKNVEDVDLQADLDGVEKKIAKQKGYKIINHSLEFFGLCAKCLPRSTG